MPAFGLDFLSRLSFSTTEAIRLPAGFQRNPSPEFL